MKLKEIKSERLDILFKIRPLISKEQKKTITKIEQNELNRFQSQYQQLSALIPDAESQEVREKFGEESQIKWEERAALLSELRITDSEKGQRLVLLNKELKDVIEYIQGF